jgi:hypothetical protein
MDGKGVGLLQDLERDRIDSLDHSISDDLLRLVARRQPLHFRIGVNLLDDRFEVIGRQNPTLDEFDLLVDVAGDCGLHQIFGDRRGLEQDRRRRAIARWQCECQGDREQDRGRDDRQ